MTRFILRTLLGAPTWLLYIAIQIPLIAIGFPLVALLALYVQLAHRYTAHQREGDGLLHWPTVLGVRLFYLWDNDEDGIDGDPWTVAEGDVKNLSWFEATSTWSVWRRVFVWSAWRNSVGNARRLPFLGMDLKDPKDVVVYLPDPTVVYAGAANRWPEYRKLGPYLARYGYRWELRFPWPASDCPCSKGAACTVQPPVQRFFWIGWRIAQTDAPTKDIGLAFQPFAKL